MATPLLRSNNGIFDTTSKSDWQINTAHRNTIESPLLRLPRELRDEIWKLCLPLTIRVSKKLPQQTNSTPSILLVSRQTYAEAATMDYQSLLTWSFSSPRRYEDWLWTVLHKRSKVYRLRVCADVLDLYSMAEVEDPGYVRSDDPGNSTSEDFSLSTPSLQAFPNLEELEVWIPGLYMNADSDSDSDGLPEEGSATRVLASEDEMSTENFTKTMRDEHPRVKVTYTRFPDVRAMKTCWLDCS
ncbi:hypothetical protein PTNB73_09690 [Pyrenophora teres f. teres]|nr:hypothetical protein HRS9122_08621 [Pyrenophora teres f. teres]KAE8856425.1 hypothetical protein PTNB73_09690 [Pyrenophora teres f. teres]